MKTFPFYKQLDAMDCGPSCLRMVAKHYGRSYTLQYLRDISYIDREGVSLKGISEAAEKIGFQPMAVKIPFSAPNGSSLAFGCSYASYCPLESKPFYSGLQSQ